MTTEKITSLDFTTDIQEPVKVLAPDGNEYFLHEADGENGTTFKNKRNSLMKFNEEGRVVGFNDVHILETLIISYCLKDATGKPVPVATFNKWPNRVKEKLAETALQISGLRQVGVQYADLLERALNNPEGPVKWEALRDWIMSLDPKEFKALQDLMGDDTKKE